MKAKRGTKDQERPRIWGIGYHKKDLISGKRALRKKFQKRDFIGKGGFTVAPTD